jgi:hypothetical protein
MGYSVSRGITFEEAKKKMSEFEYALVFSMSSRELRSAKEIEVSQDECLDARFFSDKGELHVYRDGDDLKAVEVSDCDDSSASGFVDAVKIEKRYELDRKSQENVNGKLLIVHEYLTADEDGQMSVSLTRLAGIE